MLLEVLRVGNGASFKHGWRVARHVLGVATSWDAEGVLGADSTSGR